MHGAETVPALSSVAAAEEDDIHLENEAVQRAMAGKPALGCMFALAACINCVEEADEAADAMRRPRKAIMLIVGCLD